jgi:hypothetical protein
MMKHPIIIAGPCSAETEEQVRTAANELKDFRLPVSAAGKVFLFSVPGYGNPEQDPEPLKEWGKRDFPG